MDTFFGAPAISDEEESSSAKEAISDEMNNAMVASMPLRNVVTFGLLGREELENLLNEINQQ